MPTRKKQRHKQLPGALNPLTSGNRRPSSQSLDTVGHADRIRIIGSICWSKFRAEEVDLWFPNPGTHCTLRLRHIPGPMPELPWREFPSKKKKKKEWRTNFNYGPLFYSRSGLVVVVTIWQVDFANFQHLPRGCWWTFFGSHSVWDYRFRWWT